MTTTDTPTTRKWTDREIPVVALIPENRGPA
jgi:hypothetical protein